MKISYFMNKKGNFCKVETNSNMHLKMKLDETLEEVHLPSITVSIPVYKSKGVLKKATQYVLRQTYPNFNLIVFSDCDPDNTVKEIEGIRDKRLSIVKSEQNIGRYAIDHLIVTCMTKSEYWVPVDSDDWCEETFLTRLVGKLIKFPTSDVIFAGQIIHKGYSKRRARVREWDGTSDLIWHAHMSALWRREFLLDMNLTNPNFRIGWDSIVTSVPWLVGEVNYIDDCLYHRVSRKDSLTRSPETKFGSEHRNRVKKYVVNLWKEIVEARNVNEVKQILLRSRNEQY